MGDPLDAHQPRWEHAGTLRQLLVVLQYAYPLFMLCFFLAAFTLRSIAASNSNTNIAKPTTTGPGGKPLPATDPTRNFVKKTVHDDVTQTQKRVFEWLSLAAALTFFGNSVLVIAQALAKQSEQWWCGKPVVVCIMYIVGNTNVTCFVFADRNHPDLPRRLLLRLQPLPHLTARLEALADCCPLRNMDRRTDPRSRPSRLLARHLHTRPPRTHGRQPCTPQAAT
jgi:hypothetical protein